MISTFLIILGILTLLGSGNANDACLITLLLKILPGLLVLLGIFLLVIY